MDGWEISINLELYDVFEKYEIVNVTDDTRNVVKGSLFVAIKGENFDGEQAAEGMLRKGAVAVITQRDLGLGTRQILVGNVRLAFALASSCFCGKPTEKLKLIAVTGTNGKSTVASLIKSILEKAGHKTGFIGTTGYDVCAPGGQVYSSNLSTPRQDELYRLFAEMVKNNAEFCVMEASSQALDQFRIAGEVFLTGVFTNLTRDHLDWHKTMESYYQAKKSLFGMCKSAVICVDDEYGERLADEIRKEINIPVITYSIVRDNLDCVNEPVDFYAVNIKTSSSGVSYWLSDSDAEKSFRFKFKMPGRFNAANSLAAVAACKAVGFDVGKSVKALEECTGVRGRCEVIYDGDFTVICDYAHTEDALVKILTCVREFAKRRVICLFGAAGERDTDKRPLMGAVAAKYADFLIITSDNPRFESPRQIIEQVENGCKASGVPYRTFVDRREAIAFALAEAEKEDIVLLCGKGHETEQVIGDAELPFDERAVVNDFIGGRC